MPSLAIDSMLTLKKSLINTLENELFFCQPTSGITKEKLFKSNKRCTGWTNRYFQTSAWATFKRKNTFHKAATFFNSTDRHHCTKLMLVHAGRSAHPRSLAAAQLGARAPLKYPFEAGKEVALNFRERL